MIILLLILLGCESPLHKVSMDMAQTTLVVNGDYGVFANPPWTTVGTTPAYNCIDEGVSTPSDSHFLRIIGSPGDASNATNGFLLQDGPADIDAISSVDFRMRARLVPISDLGEPYNSLIRIKLWGNTLHTIYHGEHEFQNNSGGPSEYVKSSSWGNTGYKTISGLSITKAQWANCVIQIDGELFQGDNSFRLELNEVDIRINYTQVVATSTPVHKMHIGMGFGPGFR